MNFKKVFIVIISSALLFASCSSSGRMGKGGCGCAAKRGMVGY